MEHAVITPTPFGPMNGHLIGAGVREVVIRANQLIFAKWNSFKEEQKEDRPDGREDFVTDADKEAQKLYVKLLRERYPLFGIVAEEADLSIPCTHPHLNIFFTVDPLDGTKAYIRRQSDSIGTMISLCCNGVVICAYIGDCNTGEIYGYRPGSNLVHRIRRNGDTSVLSINEDKMLSTRYVMLRDFPREYSDHVQKMVRKVVDGGIFSGGDARGGSIGVTMARLWKDEIGAVILHGTAGVADNPDHGDTPWDTMPVMGISQKLGFLFREIDAETGVLVPWRIKVSNKKQFNPNEVFIFHKSRLAEVDAWMKANH